MQGGVPSFLAQTRGGVDGETQVIADGRSLAALGTVFMLALAPFTRQIELRKRRRGYYGSRQQNQIRALHFTPQKGCAAMMPHRAHQRQPPIGIPGTQKV